MAVIGSWAAESMRGVLTASIMSLMISSTTPNKLPNDMDDAINGAMFLSENSARRILRSAGWRWASFIGQRTMEMKIVNFWHAVSDLQFVWDNADQHLIQLLLRFLCPFDDATVAPRCIQKRSFAFFNLPGELRNKIYDHAIVEERYFIDHDIRYLEKRLLYKLPGSLPCFLFFCFLDTSYHTQPLSTQRSLRAFSSLKIFILEDKAAIDLPVARLNHFYLHNIYHFLQ